jgi:outer membrane protein OmpA-like peptidoglycan-associated protein
MKMNFKGLVLIFFGIIVSWLIGSITPINAQGIICTAPVTAAGVPLKTSTSQLCQTRGEFVAAPTQEIVTSEPIQEPIQGTISEVDPAGGDIHTGDTTAITHSPEPDQGVIQSDPGVNTPFPLPLIESEPVRSFTVHFDTGSSMPNTPSEIDEAVSAIHQFHESQNVTILIRGHADTEGSKARNLVISQARAETVRDSLIEKGIGLSPILRSFGEEHLAVPTDDGVAEPENRRVEILLCTVGITETGECIGE